MELPPPDRPDGAARLRRHWRWFAVLLGAVTVLGIPVALFAMLSLAMATDPCYTPDSPFRVCTLTAAGQNVFGLIPWIALAGALVSALVSANLLAKHRISPLYGLVVWFLGAVITAAAATEIAYQV